MRSIWILCLAVAVWTIASPAVALKEEQREKVRQQIESVKVWQLTRDLDLSEEQAQSFFPAQKNYMERKESLRHEREAAERELEELLNRRAEQKLITQQLDRIKGIDRESGSNELEFRKRIGRILSLEQQARYELFEKRFNAKLREMILDVQREEKRQDSGRGRDSLESRRESDERNPASVKPDRSSKPGAQPPASKPARDSRNSKAGQDKSKAGQDKSKERQDDASDEPAPRERPSRESGSSGERSSRR